MKQTARQIARSRWALDFVERGKLWLARISVSPSRTGYTVMVNCANRKEVMAVVEAVRAITESGDPTE